MSSSLNRLPKGLVCYVEEPGQKRSPLITYKGDGLFDVPDGSAENPGSSRTRINHHHVIGWYDKYVLGITSLQKWRLERESIADWRPLACIFVDRGEAAMPIYPADQPLSVVLTFTDEEMEGVGEKEESLFTPRASAVVEPVDPPAPAPVVETVDPPASAEAKPVDRAFLSHLPRGLKCYFQEGPLSPVMMLELYNAPWGHPKDNLFFNWAALGPGLYPESKVRAFYREKHPLDLSSKSDLECIYVEMGQHHDESLASLAHLDPEELARVGTSGKSINLRVSRLKLLPNGLKLFAVIDGRIETGFDFTEMQLHDWTGPVLGYRHLPTKRKASLKEASDLLASVFKMPDYEEPPGTWGISAFWVQEGNFKNTRLDDLLDWLDDEHLPTVGLEEVREDPLVAAKARLEAELALIQAELDKKHQEIAAIEAVQRSKIELLEAERKMAVSRKERDLAERRALGMVPY